ncbi:LysM repeat protein [Desulfitispora alkaliphila]|uniref:LysM peptidoglycan-binding domain-containing protein n=1 Tax=Desulfitispora alkaliphila TaxID=622674 RepID=UPI003D242D62
MSHKCPEITQPYTIKPGDTFFKLSQRFNTTVAAIQSANPNVNPLNLQIGQVICIPKKPAPTPTPVPTPTPRPPFPECPPDSIFFEVDEGDTLATIADEFGLSVRILIAANPHIDPSVPLVPGEILCIPPVPECPENTTLYLIEEGDTFATIAELFGIELEALIDLNPHVDSANPEVGVVICLPVDFPDPGYG